MPGRDPLGEPQDQPEVLHVGADRGGDARVLDLDRDLAPVCSRARYTWPIEAAAIGSSSNSSNTSFSGSSSSSSITLRMSLKVTVRRRVAQRRELALELLAVLLGHHADVEERQHLPDLHRGALHRPERGDDLLGRLDLAALERDLAPLRGCASTLAARVPAWRIA